MSGEVTPNRATSLVLTTVESSLKVRDPWRKRVTASQMAKTSRKRPTQTAGVFNTGDAWILNPMYQDLSRAATSTFAAGVITAAQVTLATGWAVYDSFRKLDFNGLTSAADLVSRGMAKFMKGVATGERWNRELAADVAAFPKPLLETNYYAMERFLAGKITYPPNTPFAIQVQAPQLDPGDNLVNFYFGGETDCDPADAHAGEYCLNLRLDGKARLFEKNGSTWERRHDFTWAPTGEVAGVRGAIVIIPYGRDRMLISAVGENVPGGTGGGRLVDAILANVGVNRQSTRTIYRESRSVAGHVHKHRMTGAGTIRMDMREDLRLPTGVHRLLFPAAGTLVDDAFHVPFPVLDGMTLGIELEGDTPSGTTLAATLFRADTDEQLTQNEDDEWELVAGVQNYYVVWDYNCPNQDQTPLLEAYTVVIDGLIETGAATTVTLDVDHANGVQIQGSGSDPATGSAYVTVMDAPGPRFGQARVLKARSRIKAEIQTTVGDTYSVLFAGETEGESIDAILRVTDDNPAVGRWFEYGVPLGPEFGRIADQFGTDLLSFHQDRTADPLPDGRYPPWKITSIIRALFNLAGVTDDQLDIPDLDLRLWVGPGFDPEDFMLQPATKFAQAILKYARDYLDMWVAYDPNTSPAKWRLLYQPAPPYNPLHTFVLGSSTPNTLPHHANTYGSGTSFILSETYRIKPVAPEANFVLVVGAGGILPDNGGKNAIYAWDWNPNSFNLNPAHPTAITDPDDPRFVDYMGRKVPLLYVDPTILTQEGANYLCRRLLLKVGYGHHRAHFRAPLCLVTDPNDSLQARPRPLRVADAITVPVDEHGTAGIGILDQSPTLDYTSDGEQWQDVECVIARDA